jgi:release factor glutamine methyltransferase
VKTIAAALAAAREKLPGFEARLLLGQVLRQPPVWLLTHDDAVLDDAALCAFNALVMRRHAGEPVAYLLGHREFFGRDFAASPAALIPRPETELLVEVALSAIKKGKVGADGTAAKGGTARNAPRILDLGTGTGCIAITLALEYPSAQVTALDASRDALALATENAHRLNANVRFLHSDWYAAVAGETFDLIVSNPPYIAAADAHLTQGDLRFEPPAALASGVDGLDAIRHIIAAAPAHLSAQGQLWLEHGFDQADAVRALLAAAGFTAIEQHRDLAGIVRVSGGVWCDGIKTTLVHHVSLYRGSSSWAKHGGDEYCGLSGRSANSSSGAGGFCSAAFSRAQMDGCHSGPLESCSDLGRLRFAFALPGCFVGSAACCAFLHCLISSMNRLL